MAERVKDLMLSLSEYAVVDEDATVFDALTALHESQAKLPPDRQPHRAVLVRNARGTIVGKLHHFAFLRALIPERKFVVEREVLRRAGVSDDLLQSSMQTLDLFASGLVNLCVRARSVPVRDVYTPTTAGIDEDANLTDAAVAFLTQQAQSLLIRRGQRTVGILRLSDLFDELARQIRQDECPGDPE